jgi:hypothetical protein
MANYDIPDLPTKRLRYFNNQFLIDQDFIDDDAWQIGHERAFLRSLCVAGVCEGLNVSYPANKPPSVSPGVAIDSMGRMIVIATATDALVKPDALADGDYFLHISFLESEDVKATGDKGTSDYTRWTQTPPINATAKNAALPDGAVVLGSCTVQNKAFVGSGTTVGRQYSGVRLPGFNKNVTATLRNTGAADDLAVLSGSLTIRRDAASQRGPTLTLFNAAGGAGAGAAIDFNGYDPGVNNPTLRVQSLDDGNFSSHLAFSTKLSGANANQLVERLRLTSDGLLRFSNDAPKDKIVIYDNGPADRYGLGLNGGNINLFCPAGARFSLRQASATGNEVFSVTGTGTVTLGGPVTGGLSVQGLVDITATATTSALGWLEAIRFSRTEHSAITHPAGKLLFGMHGNRNFYFGDTNANVYLVTITPTAGGSIGIGTNGPPERPFHIKSSIADWQARFQNDSATANVYLAHGGGYGMHVRTDTAAPNNYLLQLYNATQGGSLFYVATSGDVSMAKTLTVSGVVTAPAGVIVEGAVPHIERDGALYRNTDGQVYVTVDDNFYIRDASSGASWAAHFDTNAGSLELKGGLVAHGYGMLTDPSGSFNTHLPFSDNNSYVTGNNIFLRGGQPTGYNTILTASSSGTVTVAGQLDVGGAWLTVKGAGTEQAYVGGDGAGNDVQIGSTKAGPVTVAAWNWATGWMDVAGRNWLGHSDARSKDNVETIDHALAKVMRLRGVSFDWKADDGSTSRSRNLGLIAQEVRAVVPEAVAELRGGSLAIAYNAITALTVEALKEQQKQIDELRAALQQQPARRHE